MIREKKAESINELVRLPGRGQARALNGLKSGSVQDWIAASKGLIKKGRSGTRKGSLTALFMDE